MNFRLAAVLLGSALFVACAGGSPATPGRADSSSPSPIVSPTPSAFSTSSMPASPSPMPQPSATTSLPTLSPSPTGSVQAMGTALFTLQYNTTGLFAPNSVSVSSNGQQLTFTNVRCYAPANDPAECFLQLSEPPGTSTYLFRAFPNAEASGSPTAVGSATVAFTANSSTNVSVTMNGVPAALAIAVNPSTVVADGVGGTITGLVKVLDNTGGAPLSPSSYVDANDSPLSVSVSDSDRSGATTILPSSISKTSQQASYPAVTGATPIEIGYNGSRIGNVTFTASAASITAASASLVIESVPSNEERTVYVASHNSSSDEIDEYPLSATGSAAPIRTLTGSLSLATGLATDASGNLYVSNERTSTGEDALLVFAPGASGNATPTQLISGSNTALNFPIALALDSMQNTYVLNAGPSTNEQFISAYSAGSNGNVAPLTVISGPLTMLGGAASIAIDGASNIYVLNNSLKSGTEGELLVFRDGSTGNTTPTNTIITQMRLISLAAAPTNLLYGGYDDGVATLMAATGSTSNCVNLQSSTSPQGGPVAVDAAGEVFFGNPALNAITLYPPSASGAACYSSFPYRSFSLPAGRTIDAVALGR